MAVNYSMSKDEESLTLEFNEKLLELRIKEARELLEKAEDVKKYLDGEPNYSRGVVDWNLVKLRDKLVSIDEIRSKIKELKGIDDYI